MYYNEKQIKFYIFLSSEHNIKLNLYAAVAIALNVYDLQIDAVYSFWTVTESESQLQ